MRIAARAPWLLALAGLVAPASASAQSKQQCADAYVTAQVARKDGKLRDARAKLEVCSAATCPATLRRDCGPWLAQVEKDIPTLAVKVEGAADARVTVDGAPLDAAGRIDPGEHVVRVEASGMKPAEQRVRLSAGEGRREVVIHLEREAPPPPPEVPRTVPVAPIVLGGVGLVGLGAFIALGVAGNGKKADLDALGCKPNCSPDDVSSIKTLYIAADVSLGVGLASLVAAGVTLAVELAGGKPAASAEPRVGFTAGRGGGAFTFRF